MLDNIEEIGKRIKDVREENGIKQQVLAMQAKMDSASLSRYENGKQTPSLESFVNIAQSLNVSTDYLLFGNEKKKIFANNERKISWSELVCQALATLIEYGIISVVDNESLRGFGLNIQKNIYILEFFDKCAKLCEVKDTFSKSEEFAAAKQNLIDKYCGLIIQEDYNLTSSPFGAPSYSELMENEKKANNKVEEIVKNHIKK